MISMKQFLYLNKLSISDPHLIPVDPSHLAHLAHALSDKFVEGGQQIDLEEALQCLDIAQLLNVFFNLHLVFSILQRNGY
jgi:hypothetical protein